ncbi:MAG: 3-oxoadipate enol-lactonase [Terracidiphilus sp.]
MPTVESNGARLHYEVSGGTDAPNLVLLNSLGSNLQMWDRVLPEFEEKFRVLRSDMRGHGRSEVAAEAFTIEQLGRDVLKLMDEVKAEKASICGVSLGGLAGLWLGIYAPDRVERLILANTAAKIGTKEIWEQRIEAVKANGMAALAAATLERWYTPVYRQEHPEEMEKIRRMIAATDPQGYAACCAVLRDADLRAEAAGVRAVTLVIAGAHDPATPPADGRALHTAIEHSRYVEFDASHMSAWECAADFAGAVVEHLTAMEVTHG